jgi:arylformamidase
MSQGTARGRAPHLVSWRPLIDISVTIRSGMPVYKGDPGVEIDLARSIDRGDDANVSRLQLGAHTGTHVDAPRHFLPDGPGADELPLEPVIGPCVVADATATDGRIDAACIESLGLAPGTDRVLLKTPNSRLWERDAFVPDFTRLDASGADALVAHGVRLVGIDYLSLGDRAVHTTLLTRGIGVIEGLDLRAVDPGGYVLVCLPLKIAGCDGAPARAVLLPLSSAGR